MKMHKVLVIDNYDSFTYNLVHCLQNLLNKSVEVKRNDELDFEYVDRFDYLVLSPGTGVPDEAGDLKKVIHTFAPSKKILGVCLGHQAIGEVFGAQLRNLDEVYHGVQTTFYHTGTSVLFQEMDKEFLAGRYHSWVIHKDTLPTELRVTCIDDQGEIMAIEHSKYAVFGVQFHPESILTPNGETMLSNFLSVTK